MSKKNKMDGVDDVVDEEMMGEFGVASLNIEATPMPALTSVTASLEKNNNDFLEGKKSNNENYFDKEKVSTHDTVSSERTGRNGTDLHSRCTQNISGVHDSSTFVQNSTGSNNEISPNVANVPVSIAVQSAVGKNIDTSVDSTEDPKKNCKIPAII